MTTQAAVLEVPRPEVIADGGRAAGATPQRSNLIDMRTAALDLGPLQKLLDDPTVCDILVNGAQNVYIERDGRLELTDIRFRDDAELLATIQRIVSFIGRRVDASSPLVDARLPDGSRVNAAVPPVAVDGPSLSIRRFGRTPLLLEDLIAKKALTSEMSQCLQGCVEKRLNVLIAGGTGSGKTTLLNALSRHIPERERIVTIEDAAELHLQQAHVVRLETRPFSVEGDVIHIRQLVVNALRMRPDRIVVGEVRSDEALDMLQAMNTGHDGSLTTIHANTPRDALSRLEVMVGMANSNLGSRNIRQQIVSAINLIVQTARMSDGTRKVTHIVECQGMEGEVITLQDIFTFERSGLNSEGRVMGRFRASGLRPKFYEKLKAAGLELPVSIFNSVVPVN
jgi:pilus assembly protein CpaF